MKRSAVCTYVSLPLLLLCISLSVCSQTGCGKSENSLSQDVTQSEIEEYEQMLKESQERANAEEEE
ncbi:MAG: hypothetical protein ACF8CQ_12655 [Rhodopirellula sp. JB044]|uniref:hypothetical protein n=1 Tax=Rhodopirellula sp. JB044 TaxID=3342844 RepID=UPI00370AA376